MLQEQVSEYLGVTSFKRKYPGTFVHCFSNTNYLPNGCHTTTEKETVCVLPLKDLERRDLSHKEKLYLREQNVITETQCTLGKSIF